MRVLLTGGGGFLGTVLTDLLLNHSYQVRVLDNLFRESDYLISKCNNPNFEFYYGDVIDESHVKNAMKDVDAVIHLAALVGEPICKKMPAMASLVNIEGTYNVCKYKPKTIPMIFASTGSVYGKVDGVCKEDSPLNALSHYAITKIEGEKLVKRTPNAAVYRFSTAFGISGNMRVNLLVNDLSHRAVHEKALVIFQPDFRRSFIHTRDIASAILFGLLNMDKMSYETFNVGHPEGNWTKRELAEYIKTKTRCFISYADTGYVDTDQRDYEIDFSKIYDLGWKAEISIEEGIDELLKSASLMTLTHRWK